MKPDTMPKGASKPLTPEKIRAAAGAPLRRSTCVNVDGKAVHVTMARRKLRQAETTEKA